MANPTQPNVLLTRRVSHPHEDTHKPPDLRITLDHTVHCLAVTILIFPTNLHILRIILAPADLV